MRREPLESASDARLMELTRDGMRGAFEELMARHQAPLLVFFRKLGRDAQHAEDDVQETLLRIYAARGRYRPIGTFRAFLYTVARSVWHDRLRRASRSGRIVSLPRYEPADPASVAPHDPSSLRMDVEAALRSLPERMRVVLVLSVYQGLSYPEIAEVLRIPLGTVKTRAFHAVRRLREELATYV